MNRSAKTSVAVVMLILTALSAIASELPNANLGVVIPSHPVTLTAPTVVTRKVTLNSSELEKYQLMGVQSQSLANHEAAGASATTKTVLIVAGVVVVVLIVVAASSGSIVGDMKFTYPN